MSDGGGVSFTFESASVDEIIKKRGLEAQGFVQQYIDSEVMRHMEPYMPKLTGTMINQMIIPTVIGGGEVVVETPYARARSKSARNNGLRGPKFFERMKADHRDDILDGAAKLSGGKPSYD